METLTLTTLFWLSVLGAVVGWIAGFFVKNEGIALEYNVIWGITSALLIGVISLLMELGGPLLFSFVGTLASLFIVNLFHLHHIEDLFEDSATKKPRKPTNR